MSAVDWKLAIGLALPVLVVIIVLFSVAEKLGKMVGVLARATRDTLVSLLAGASMYAIMAVGFQFARMHLSREQIVYQAAQLDNLLVHCGFNLTALIGDISH